MQKDYIEKYKRLRDFLLNKYCIETKNTFMIDYILSFSDPYIANYLCSEIREFYDMFDIVPENMNIFSRYCDKLFELYPELLNNKNNLLELGCGYVPVLANRISNKNIKNRLEIYDPKLIVDSIKTNNNIILNKSKFNSDDYKKYDLVYSFMPFGGEKKIIEKAVNSDSNFFICMSYDYTDCFDDSDSKLESLLKYAYDFDPDIKCLKLGKINYSYDYPVIYRKK